MNDPSARPLPLTDPAFAPLLREDLPSFVVALPDGVVVAATASCASLGIALGVVAPGSTARIARRVAALAITPRREQAIAEPAPDIRQGQVEHVPLPADAAPRAFSCRAIPSIAGQFVMFADPRAVAPEQTPSTAAGPLMPPAPVLDRCQEGIAQAPRGLIPGLDASPPSQPGLARPIRFTWESDGAGCLVRLSAAFLEHAGRTDLPWHGQRFTDVLATLGFVDVQPLAEALGGSGSFCDLILETPAGGRLSLGGMPAAVGAAARGFGLFWPAPAVAADPIAPALEVDDRPPGNVVPLRGGSLNAHERSAFHEIARTLNDAIDAWQKAPADAVPPAPRAAPEEAVPQVSGEWENEDTVLDHLPIGLVVQHGAQVVRVNRTLLDWCGMDSAEAFEAAGGLPACLGRMNALGPLALGGPASPRIPVDVRVVSATWAGRTALVHVVRRLEGSDSAGMPEAPVKGALDLIPVGILILDRTGAIENVNAALARSCGFTGRELKREPFTVIFAPASRADAVALLDEVATCPIGRARSATLRLRARDGMELDVAATLAPVDGQAPHYCLVLRPVEDMASESPEPSPALPAPALPDRTPLDDAWLRAGVDDLARRLSHGLRGPLTTLMGFAEAVQAGAFGPVGDGRYLRHADAALEAGRQVLATLEDMEELFPEPVSGMPETADMGQVMEGTVASLDAMARRRRVLVRLDLAPDLVVPARPSAWARIMRLLLEEALRATPAGGQVLVSARRDAQGVVLLVRDDGPALSEQEIAQSLTPLAAARGSDRFARAGRPFRLARIGALARAENATLSLRPGVARGMLAELRLPDRSA